eukprot:1062150-Alexandrium_andersonii.AAC.1
MSGSGVNAACQPAERLRYDTIDQLVRCVCELAADGEAAPAIWKADIDSADRRVPVVPDQRRLLGVAVVARR